MARMTGAKFFAESIKAYGVSHVFVSPSVANLALAEASALGIKNIVPHGEKPTAMRAQPIGRAFAWLNLSERQTLQPDFRTHFWLFRRLLHLLAERHRWNSTGMPIKKFPTSACSIQ